MDDDIRSAIRAVVAKCDPEKYEAEGDAWILRYSPDDAELSVDALTDAILQAVRMRRG